MPQQQHSYADKFLSCGTMIPMFRTANLHWFSFTDLCQRAIDQFPVGRGCLGRHWGFSILGCSNPGLLDHHTWTLEHSACSSYECIVCCSFQSLETMRLCSETEFPEHVLCRLPENYLEKKTPKKVLEALAYRWHMSSSFMGRITNFMNYSDSDVRRAAIDALREQSPWSPDILEAVMCRLENDEDGDVRAAAIRALGTQSPWSSEVL